MPETKSTDINFAEILNDFLNKYREPAFGCLPKTEIDILVLEILEKIGEIQKDISQYELSRKLKISQAKARNLLYNKSIREKDLDLDDMTKELLQKPIIQKDDCGLFSFEVKHPLLIEHIKDKISQLGCISDGSFSRYIIRLSQETFVTLIASYITDKDKFAKVLKNSGISDGSLKGFLTDIVKAGVNEYAGEFGPVLIEYLPKFWQNNIKIVPELIKKFNLAKAAQ